MRNRHVVAMTWAGLNGTTARKEIHSKWRSVRNLAQKVDPSDGKCDECECDHDRRSAAAQPKRTSINMQHACMPAACVPLCFCAVWALHTVCHPCAAPHAPIGTGTHPVTASISVKSSGTPGELLQELHPDWKLSQTLSKLTEATEVVSGSFHTKRFTRKTKRFARLAPEIRMQSSTSR